MKPVGWRNESYRHYLARKGVKTKYFAPFVEKTDIPVIDYPEEYHSIQQKSIVRMSPEEFLKLAKKTSERADKSGKISNMSQEEYENTVKSEERVKSVKKGLAEGKEIPAVYIEYSAEGGPAEHEGRHRAIAARELGMKEIPVVLVRTRKLVNGHWMYGEEEGEKIPEFKRRDNE